MSSQRAPIDEAAEWLATLSDANCTPEERRAFARWLKRSNVNVEEFLKLSTLTRRLETYAEWPEVDIQALIGAARQSQTNVTQLSARPAAAVPTNVKKSNAWLPWSLAAAATAALAIGVLYLLDPAGRMSHSVYATGLGELRSVILDDGSIVQLDAQSRIRTRIDEHERNVQLLEGAAIFQVAKDADRPFRVSTGIAQIVALGTAFNVNTRQDRTVVTVMEGRVRVAPVRDRREPDRRQQAGQAPSLGAAAVELDPGQQAVIEPHKPLVTEQQVDPSEATAWTSRRLYFNETPLAEAVNEFARYSQRRIEVQDPLLAQRQITGIFDATDPASLVMFIDRYTDANIAETRDGWVVSREGR